MKTICVSERLILREHCDADLLNLHALISCPEQMKFLPNIKTETISETEKNLRHAIEESNSPTRRDFYYAIETKEGQYVGEIGVTTLIQSPQGRVGNLGYFLKKEFHGKGFASEAAKALIHYLFEQLDFVKIETGCLSENPASERVMVKCGMKKEADLEMHILHEGRLKNRVEYGITKDAWSRWVTNQPLA